MKSPSNYHVHMLVIWFSVWRSPVYDDLHHNWASMLLIGCDTLGVLIRKSLGWHIIFFIRIKERMSATGHWFIEKLRGTNVKEKKSDKPKCADWINRSLYFGTSIDHSTIHRVIHTWNYYIDYIRWEILAKECCFSCIQMFFFLEHLVCVKKKQSHLSGSKKLISFELPVVPNPRTAARSNRALIGRANQLQLFGFIDDQKKKCSIAY